MDGFGKSDPQIQQAEAGDQSAHGAVLGHMSNGGVVEKEAVKHPQMGPGQEEEDESEVEAHHDAQEEIGAMNPLSRRRRLSGNRTSRRGGGFRRRRRLGNSVG